MVPERIEPYVYSVSAHRHPGLPQESGYYWLLNAKSGERALAHVEIGSDGPVATGTKYPVSHFTEHIGPLPVPEL